MSESQRKEINDDFDLEDDENEDTQEGKYLSFRIGGEVYGIEIRHVTEIVGIQKITEVPDMPQYMKGVINLRGNVIPVVDVRLRFHMQPRDYDDRTCVIVVNINDASIGLVVDSVKEVISILPDQISPAPSVSKGEVTRYIKGIGRFDGEVIILLAIDKLLYNNQIKVSL
ncbi:MAG TPA: chemotaxis protein CheW [Candidatus Rifleibacterium sp.]|nr:chemotaxis protein CheW [Candidatus Rifleibacterium sp.]HPW57031.1 chemotaxis protein CheW [Candidatus Rifleibacterium sp.]